MGFLTDRLNKIDQDEDKNEDQPVSLLDRLSQPEPAKIDPPKQIDTTTPTTPDSPPEVDPVLPVIPEPQTAKEAMDLSKDDLVDQEIKHFYKTDGEKTLPFLGGTAGLFQDTPGFQPDDEALQKQFTGAKLSYEVANNGMEIGHIGSRIMNGNESNKDLTRLKELQARNMDIMKQLDDDTTIAEAFAQFAPYLIQSAVEGGKGAIVGGMVGGTLAGVLGNFIPGGMAAPEEILTVPAGFTLGAKIGGAYASADAITRVEQGNAFISMIDDGVDVDIARSTARVVGNINGALELVQLGALGKALPKSLVQQVTRKASIAFMKSPATKSLLKRIGAMGAEVTAENLQEIVTLYGESVGSALDKNPSFQGYVEGMTDVDGKTVWNTVAETSEITGKGLLPLFLPGMAVDVGHIGLGTKKDTSSVEKKANPDADKVVAPQDLKTSLQASMAEEDYQVKVVGPGKLVITGTENNADTIKAVESDGTPASKEITRVGNLLGDHISVQDRNIGGQTVGQDIAANEMTDAKSDISYESRGQMGIELHSTVAESTILQDERMQFEIEQAFENNDYNLARQIAAEQTQNGTTLEEAYTELIKAQDLKAKGQKVLPNENIQKALGLDLDHRQNRAAQNQKIAQENIIKQQEQQNQLLMDQLENPDLHKGILWNEHIQQKNNGNPEGAKLYDRALKETAKRENMGDLDYLDSVSVPKLSDLITDMQTYRMELQQPGSREAMLLDKTISRMEDLVLDKQAWELKKGRDEQGDIRAREAEKKRKEAEKAKAKPTTGETAGTKATRRAGTQAAGGRAKDVAGKGVTPQTRKDQTNLARKVSEIKARKDAVQKQQEQQRQADSKLKRLRDERLKKEKARAEEAADEAKAKRDTEKLIAQNKDLFQGMKAPETLGTKAILQRLAGDKVRVDALGQKGTTTPETHVQVTIMKGVAKGATVNVPKKNFTQAVQNKIAEMEELRKPKDKISPKGAVNVFKFSDGSEVSGATSGEIYDKANAKQRAEMESGRAVEGFRGPGKPFVAREKSIVVKDLQDSNRTFGIITAENPMGNTQSDAKNVLANQRLSADLKSAGLPVTQVEGQYGNLEKPFIVEGIDQKTLSTLGKKYGQESVIHMEGDKAVYLEGSKAVDTVSRSDIRKSPDATDFYTKLPDGTKFQIPFFEDIEQKIQSARDEDIILDLTNLRSQGRDFVNMIDAFARHIKHGKRSWLHKLVKASRTPYYFVNGIRGLESNEEFMKLTFKQRETVLNGFDDNLGIFIGSATSNVKGIFINMNTILGKLQDVEDAFTVIDHEALHAAVTEIFGRGDSKARQEIRNNLRQLWETIPDSMKQTKFNTHRNGWDIGNLFIEKDQSGVGEKLVRQLETGIRQTDGHIDELVTHGFTNPTMAKWLDSMESSQAATSQGKIATLWQELKSLVATKILGMPSKLDDVATIMDQALAKTGKEVRFSKSKGTAKGLSKARVNVFLKPVLKKMPNAAKTMVYATEAELPANLQLSTEARDAGVKIESVYDDSTDTVHIVAENIKDEAHLLKKMMHENVAHKGLRTIFPSKATFEKFLGEATGVLFKAGKEREIDNVSLMYHNDRFVNTTKKQKLETIEEYLALNFAENLDLKSKRGILAKLMDIIKRWLPIRVVDRPSVKLGDILTMDDLGTIMEAAKHSIMGKQPKLAKAILKSFADRSPRNPNSINDVKFQRTVKGYVKAVKEVMAEMPEAKQWYPAHLQRLEKVFGRDGLLFNLLLSITSPQSKVVENVGHAVETYLYILGHKERPGGLYWSQVQQKVDEWRTETDVLNGIGKQFKVNEFVRGLLGDKNATVLDIWMHRLFFGADTKSPGKEVFITSEGQAGRQMLFDISKAMEHDTGEQWSPRDIQAVLWTWIKAKQEGTSFKEVPNFETGFITPREKYEGRTALEELHKFIPEADVLRGPLSDQLNITGFSPTPISRMEKSRMLQMSRVPHIAKMGNPVDGKYTNEDSTAGFTVNPETGEISDVFANVDTPGIYTEMVVQAIANGGRWTMAPLDYSKAYEHAGFVFDLTDTTEGEFVKIHIPDYVIDSYRNARGKVTATLVRNRLGGSELDLEPRTAHRYSLAKTEWTDSNVVDEDGLFSKDGQPKFLNKLFEWKDQADLNIQREINRLEQDLLEQFGGSRTSKLVPFSTGMYANNAKTRLLQKAMNLYIDSGEKTPHLKFVRKYMHELEGQKKLTNIEKDRLAIINRMLEMTEEEKAWADSNIRPWYDEIYQYAKDRDILDSYVESYVSRAWKVPKGHDVVGAANTEQTSGSFSNFAITTPHAKQRKFNSIVDGWRMGIDWTLKQDALLPNLHTYMNQINEVAGNKRFINYMKEMVDTDGRSLIDEDMTDQTAREAGYVQLIAKGFAAPMKKIYARKDIAKVLNKATKQEASDLWNIPGILAMQKLNAIVKGSILSLSAFHHLAGVRSWEFGVKKGLKLNPVKAYKDGLHKIESRMETNPGGYDLGPTADFLIKHGLTIGKIQDWDQSVLAGEKSVIEGVLSKSSSKVTKGLLDLKRTLRHGREMWTRSLFGRLFAGLKVEAGSMELAHSIKVAEKQKGEALTSDELDEIGRNTARLINADFGGLHLKRMGRNVNLQKVAQLLLLAPDWTESNFRTVTGAMGMNGFINKMISDFPAPAGMQKVYRKFWGGIAMRLMIGYALAIGATMAVADPEDREKYLSLLEHSFTDFEEFKKARWTGIPLDPWLNRIPGWTKEDEWTGFRLGGHFFDILKVMEPDKLIKHKASPLIRTVETLGTGTDWKGAPIVGIGEMLKTGKIVSDNPFERERNFFNRIIPTVAYEARAATPIFIQEGLRQIQGEAQLSEFGRAAGIDIRPMRIPNPIRDEYTEIDAEINAIERGIKDAEAIKDKTLIAEAKKKRAEFRYDYNRTKSRLGYAKKRMSKINAKIKVLNIKQKLGKELSLEETKRLKDLEAQKQSIMEKFLEVVEGNKP